MKYLLRIFTSFMSPLKLARVDFHMWLSTLHGFDFQARINIVALVLLRKNTLSSESEDSVSRLRVKTPEN